ncbi:uncharacterized protein LOC131231439 isoform X2 [Magnolia sinica]|uniref:uncharacterized protein LOC131231439 isoform X2 n=1 Tax=Magnolia sinica TaxID=86752 RepID=UPI00265B4CCD|nr:uncharacterized protein LOC131231439 isoform X2 [Magnolia sinica]
MPVLILSMKESKQKNRPAIVFLHSSHKMKEWVRPLLEAWAVAGSSEGIANHFYELVPDMALDFPFELDKFQKEEPQEGGLLLPLLPFFIFVTLNMI